MAHINKSTYYQSMLDTLNEKLILIGKEIALAKESRDNEAKSSAGDKYETSRAMLHIDIQNKENQKSEYLSLLKLLTEVDMDKAHTEIGFGSLVQTSNGTYFISAALGKIKGTDGDFYAISMASPLGNILKGNRVGELVKLNGRNFEIKGIS